MPATAFSQLEATLASSTLAAFENVRLILADGVSAFVAVMDTDVEVLGEFGLTSEARSRVSVASADAANFTGGATISLDPATYTTDEILAAPRAAWKLDRKASDDGHVAVWWLK